MKYWDKAWSLVDGCTPVSPACKNCWLAGMEYRFSKKKVIATVCKATGGNPYFIGEVTIREDRLDLPLKTKKPTTWAIWSDLFHEKVPNSFIHDVFLTMASRSIHKFLVLTKRPQRMNQFVNKCIHPDRYSLFNHVYLATTIENQETADLRLPYIKDLPFKTFLSVEPMLSPIKIPPSILKRQRVVIAGCESGPGARETKWEWLEDLREQCVEVGVPYWIKQVRIGSKLVFDYHRSTIKREDLWKK